MHDGEPRVVTNAVERSSGTHKAFRRLYSTEGLETILPEHQWRRQREEGRIRPIEADQTLRVISACIGSVPDRIAGRDDTRPLTPQNALQKALGHLRLCSIGESHDLNPNAVDSGVVPA